MENMTMPDWEYIINTNLLGYIRNVQALLPHFWQEAALHYKYCFYPGFGQDR
jgi:NAD(P)-dependent dehydrogenase (short-subunit alcohol dehydrogenase family)